MCQINSNIAPPHLDVQWLQAYMETNIVKYNVFAQFWFQIINEHNELGGKLYCT